MCVVWKLLVWMDATEDAVSRAGTEVPGAAGRRSSHGRTQLPP